MVLKLQQEETVRNKSSEKENVQGCVALHMSTTVH